MLVLPLALLLRWGLLACAVLAPAGVPAARAAAALADSYATPPTLCASASPPTPRPSTTWPAAFSTCAPSSPPPSPSPSLSLTFPTPPLGGGGPADLPSSYAASLSALSASGQASYSAAVAGYYSSLAAAAATTSSAAAAPVSASASAVANSAGVARWERERVLWGPLSGMALCWALAWMTVL